MTKPKSYAIGVLKALPLNRRVEKGDTVQWINELNETFYATVVNLTDDEAEVRNYYPTSDSHYCFTSDKLNRFVPLDMCLFVDNKRIGSVSKNVIDSFLKNEASLNDSVWYETRDNAPRIHRRNLICK